MWIYLDDIQSLVLFNQQVDFKPTCLPVVIQVGLNTAMHNGLVDFGDDPAFEDCTAQEVKAELLLAADTQ